MMSLIGVNSIYLSVFVCKLEGLDKPQGLIDISANREVVDSDLSECAIAIYDEKASEGDTVSLLQDAIRPADSHALVSKERDVHVSQSTSLATLLTPGKVREVGVGGARDNRAVQSFKLCHTVREGDDLGWTDEGEVERIEEKHDILPLVVVERDLFELPVDTGHSCELGSRHSRLESHGGVFVD